MRHPLLSILVAAALAAACSSNPTSPSPTPDPIADPGRAPGPAPGPPPRTETRYDVVVTVRYIDISPTEACDGRIPIINAINEGEFQYRIELSAAGRQRASLETEDYNTLTGYTVLRGQGERINFTNRTWTVRDLESSENLVIALRGTEWDTPIRDPQLNDRRALHTWIMRSGLDGGTGLALTIGSATCGMTLIYDLAVQSRQVPI